MGRDPRPRPGVAGRPAHGTAGYYAAVNDTAGGSTWNRCRTVHYAACSTQRSVAATCRPGIDLTKVSRIAVLSARTGARVMLRLDRSGGDLARPGARGWRWPRVIWRVAIGAGAGSGYRTWTFPAASMRWARRNLSTIPTSSSRCWGPSGRPPGCRANEDVLQR